MSFSLFRAMSLVCMILLLHFWLAEAEQVETYRYQQQTGEQVDLFDWQLTKGENLHLKTRQQEEFTQTTFNSDLSTLSWNMQNPQSGTDLTVNRAGNTLVIRGLFAGEVINKEVQIDAAPWYQALSVSLRQFIDPGQKSIQFWTIRSDTLEVHRLQVTRQKTTLLEVSSDSVATIQLKIQPTGWRAPFWSANYWLREKDGVFIRYQGRNGAPGTPLTSVVMVSPDATGQLTERNL